MKTHWPGFLLACCLGSAAAEPDGARVLASGAAAPTPAVPVSALEESRTSPRLRDVLRQPQDDQQEAASKPYRLSSEERHRMREQLRSLAEAGHGKDKP